MTPLQIEILLHYWYRTNQYRDGDFSAPAVKEALEMFVRHDILTTSVISQVERKPKYEADREALQAYITALTNVPLPRRTWIVPEIDNRE